MTKEGKPRRGSIQFSPRKRAWRILPRVRNWPEGEGLLGFVGYKVGMLTVFAKTTNPQSPFSGKKLAKAATVLEIPPMILRAVRLYKKGTYGSRVIGDLFDVKGADVSGADFARLIFETQPAKAGFPKKISEVAEIAFGGDKDAVMSFASQNMGKEVKFSDVFSENSFADVTGVTKGKGLQGVVKRFGVKLQGHKTEKSHRKVGSLGPWTPERTPWQVPMAGQMGYHTRTDYNKQILKIGLGDLNPKSGWRRYGKIKSDYAIILGSIQGPSKRVIRLRKPIRKGKAFAYDFQKIVGDVEQ